MKRRLLLRGAVLLALSARPSTARERRRIYPGGGARAVERRMRFAVPAGVVAQVWRDGRRQARLARILASPLTDIEPLDDTRARKTGQLLGIAGTSDVVDASVVLCARAREDTIVTSDAEDLRRLDPMRPLILV